MLVTATVVATYTSLACTFIPQHWVRYPKAEALVLRALADTAAAEVWYPHKVDLMAGTSTVDSTAPHVVYAQAFRVLESSGGRGIHPGSRVWVIAWGTTSMCSRAAPYRARMVSPGAQVFLQTGVRPDSLWLNGIPTIDVDGGATNYVPEWEEAGARQTPWLRRLFLRRPMSARQFKQMYDAWPTIDQWREDPQAAARLVREWAASHPDLAKLQPARRMLYRLGSTIDVIR
jgi:hypothetical protein